MFFYIFSKPKTYQNIDQHDLFLNLRDLNYENIVNVFISLYGQHIADNSLVS